MKSAGHQWHKLFLKNGNERATDAKTELVLE